MYKRQILFGCFKKYAHICSVFSPRYLQSNKHIEKNTHGTGDGATAKPGSGRLGRAAPQTGPDQNIHSGQDASLTGQGRPDRSVSFYYPTAAGLRQGKGGTGQANFSGRPGGRRELFTNCSYHSHCFALILFYDRTVPRNKCIFHFSLSFTTHR